MRTGTTRITSTAMMERRRRASRIHTGTPTRVFGTVTPTTQTHTTDTRTDRLAQQQHAALLAIKLAGQSEKEREFRTAAGIAVNSDACSVRLGNLVHDRQPKTGAMQVSCVASPEPLEYSFSVLGRNTWSVIGDTDTTVARHRHHDLAARRRMGNRILSEIADRIRDRMSVPSDVGWCAGSGERDRSLLRQCPGSHRGHYAGGDLVEIDPSRHVQCDSVQARNAQKLVDKSVH